MTKQLAIVEGVLVRTQRGGRGLVQCVGTPELHPGTSTGPSPPLLRRGALPINHGADTCSLEKELSTCEGGDLTPRETLLWRSGSNGELIRPPPDGTTERDREQRPLGPPAKKIINRGKKTAKNRRNGIKKRGLSQGPSKLWHRLRLKKSLSREPKERRGRIDLRARSEVKEGGQKGFT